MNKIKKNYFLKLDIVVDIDSYGNYIIEEQRIPVSKAVYDAYWHFENKDKYYNYVVKRDKFVQAEMFNREGEDVVDYNWDKPHKNQVRPIHSMFSKDDSELIYQKYDYDILMNKITEILDILPEVHAKRFMQFLFEEKTIEEIADLENVSKKCVYESIFNVKVYILNIL